MCTINLMENGALVSKKCGRIVITKQEDITSIPIETIDGINVYGKPQMTTQCIEECLKRGIPISFYSSYGGYLGGFNAIDSINVGRQRLQSRFNETEASFEIARKIIHAKISNQIVLLRRYSRDMCEDVNKEISNMNSFRQKSLSSDRIDQLMGYEGMAARCYFAALSKLVNPEYAFNGRSKHPPKDKFNSLLSYGYSLLYKEFYGMIKASGLNPYFGFIHSDKEYHAALVSDMIEEWRAVIIDSLVMGMINGNEMAKDDFAQAEGETSYLSRNGIKKFNNKYSRKMNKVTSYYPGHPNITYRKMMDMQIKSLIHAIEMDDSGMYTPIMIR